MKRDAMHLAYKRSTCVSI